MAIGNRYNIGKKKTTTIQKPNFSYWLKVFPQDPLQCGICNIELHTTRWHLQENSTEWSPQGSKKQTPFLYQWEDIQKRMLDSKFTIKEFSSHCDTYSFDHHILYFVKSNMKGHVMNKRLFDKHGVRTRQAGRRDWPMMTSSHGYKPFKKTKPVSTPQGGHLLSMQVLIPGPLADNQMGSHRQANAAGSQQWTLTPQDSRCF